MAEAWLKCKVLKGMFSDELVVLVAQKQGGNASFFVPRNMVQEGNIGGVDSRVRVRVLRQGDTSWAFIPTDQQTSVEVNDSDLVAA